ncbi:unnamed protein product [Somion occarium]
MSSRAKRRAEPERKSPRKSKKVRYQEDDDESDGDAYEGKDDFDDELQGLAASNIIQGRRTRGVRVDYTKVEGFPGDGDEDEDDGGINVEDQNGGEQEEEEIPKKKKRAPKPKVSKANKVAPAPKESKKASTTSKSGKNSISKSKRRAVLESDMEEESDQKDNRNKGDESKE